MTKEYRFNPGDYVYYSTHGVGRVEKIENTTLGGQSLSLLAVNFNKAGMVMRIPMTNTNTGMSNLRPISREGIAAAMKILPGKPKGRQKMWSRRAIEYESKINSGDPCLIAEVVRDLNKPGDKGEQSYSERQVFERAFERLVCEYAACEGIEESEAKSKINNILKGSVDPSVVDNMSQSLT